MTCILNVPNSLFIHLSRFFCVKRFNPELKYHYTFANIEVQKVDLSLFRKLDEKGKRSLSHQYWWSAID